MKTINMYPAVKFWATVTLLLTLSTLAVLTMYTPAPTEVLPTATPTIVEPLKGPTLVEISRSFYLTMEGLVQDSSRPRYLTLEDYRPLAVPMDIEPIAAAEDMIASYYHLGASYAYIMSGGDRDKVAEARKSMCTYHIVHHGEAVQICLQQQD